MWAAFDVSGLLGHFQPATKTGTKRFAKYDNQSIDTTNIL
jgi:hypothetical protein